MASAKIAVITGGASGIGRSICTRLAHDGIDVAVFDLDGPGGREIATELQALGRRALALQVDVTNRARVEAAVEEVHQQLGPVQILVNDAGIGEFAPFLQMTEAQWDRMIAVHLKGTFNCTRAILPDMVAAGWGRIVNLSSVAGLNGGGPGLAHYAAAKAGILGFTKAIARECGPQGITVNAIAPGLVDTPLLRKSAVPDEIIRHSRQTLPVRRIGTPDDIAAACAYLVSDAAGFVTGQVISPNGGGYV